MSVKERGGVVLRCREVVLRYREGVSSGLLHDRRRVLSLKCSRRLNRLPPRRRREGRRRIRRPCRATGWDPSRAREAQARAAAGGTPAFSVRSGGCSLRFRAHRPTGLPSALHAYIAFRGLYYGQR